WWSERDTVRVVVPERGAGVLAPGGPWPSTTEKAPMPPPPGFFHPPPAAPATTDLSGPFGPQSSAPSSRRFVEVTDGLSNTLLVTEMSGRPYLYLAGRQRVATANFPSYVSPGSVDAVSNVPLYYGWGSWAHNNNFAVGTWSADGTMQGGPCAVNCSNYRGVYSFHPSGAGAALADGSVRTLATGMPPAVFF